jgi:hypothetical protein
MSEQFPPPIKSPRPWYQNAWVVAYLYVLGFATAALVGVAQFVPRERIDDRALAFMISGGILDFLLLIPIALAVFRRPFWRIRRSRVADVILGLVLLAPCLYIAWGLVFAVALLAF